MNTNVTTTTSQSSGGTRPLVMVGGKLTQATASNDDKDKNKSAGDWAFEYRPGDKTMSMSVRVPQTNLLDPVPSNELVMSIDEKGINDLIAWLYGVKNSVASANTPSPTPAQ